MVRLQEDESDKLKANKKSADPNGNLSENKFCKCDIYDKSSTDHHNTRDHETKVLMIYTGGTIGMFSGSDGGQNLS